MSGGAHPEEEAFLQEEHREAVEALVLVRGVEVVSVEVRRGDEVVLVVSVAEAEDVVEVYHHTLVTTLFMHV